MSCKNHIVYIPTGSLLAVIIKNTFDKDADIEKQIINTLKCPNCGETDSDSDEVQVEIKRELDNLVLVE